MVLKWSWVSVGKLPKNSPKVVRFTCDFVMVLRWSCPIREIISAGGWQSATDRSPVTNSSALTSARPASASTRFGSVSPPNQIPRTFLDNHALVSVDSSRVPTIRFKVLYVFPRWLTTLARSFISMSPPIPPPGGPASNCESACFHLGLSVLIHGLIWNTEGA